MTLDPAVLANIRRIELRTKRLVDNAFAGAYHSVFKGRGIAFDSVRPYEPGDDVRDIDWNVTARAGAPFVKQYAEERELTVLLLLDSSGSARFGTVKRQKRDLAAEIGAVLAFSATTNNDKVGMLVHSDRLEQYIPPRKGRRHVLRLTRDLLTAPAVGRGTDLAGALRLLNGALKRRAIIFLLSDFLARPETYEQSLLMTAKRHDVIAVVLSDPLEQAWPSAGVIALRDAETGTVCYVDTSSRRWRQAFAERMQQAQQERDALLNRAGIDRIAVRTDGDYVRSLTEFFRQRAQRLRM